MTLDRDSVLKAINKRNETFLSLMLTLLGVIQGLAFNHLADKMPDLLSGSRLELVARWSSFTVCLLIIVRVFQTYYTAALDKVPGSIDIIDLTAIFIVGLLQYWIVNAVEPCGANVYDIMIRISALGLAATLLHCKTTFHICKGDIRSDQGKSKEQLLQTEKWNIPISMIIAILGFYGWYYKDYLNDIARVAIIGSICVLLVIMIFKSLRDAKLFELPAKPNRTQPIFYD